jgi:hypothetical protein
MATLGKNQPFYSKVFTNLLSIADVQYEIIAFVI